MPDGTQPIPEITREHFLAADALERRNRKAALPRSLKRALDDACDEFSRTRRDIHGNSAEEEIADAIRARVMLGEEIAAFAIKTAKTVAEMPMQYPRRPFTPTAELAGEIVSALMDWPLDAEFSDGIAAAAAAHELERLS